MLSSLANRHFGQDSLSWFHKSYILDWFFICLLWFFSYVISFSPVYERDFSHKDKSISHPHRKNQIGSFLNSNIALFIPLLLLIISGYKKRSLFEIHHGALGLFASRGLARLVTEYLKHKVGRLRPDFLDRCDWDKSTKLCTGDAGDILDGRKSFPSGHSSTVFAGMMVLSLWIAGQTAALCPAVMPSVKWLPTRMGSLIFTLIPLFWAIHVAVTRIEDYRHHKEDVIVGSLIGIISAVLCYLVFWPSPFHRKSFSTSSATEPRDLYDSRYQLESAYELELAATDEENEIFNV